MAKRRRCGYSWDTIGGTRSCPGPVEWLTTHVAQCPQCRAVWWWEPRGGDGKRWQLASSANPHAATQALYELAHAIRERRDREAAADRLLSQALRPG